MSDGPAQHPPEFLASCRGVVKSPHWEWQKGMRILEGWGWGETSLDRVDCSGCTVDDVLLGRPFSDRWMQCIRSPVPDLEHEPTFNAAVGILRTAWGHEAVRALESGGGWSLMTPAGQLWARTRAEVVLSGFEAVPAPRASDFDKKGRRRS